MELAGPLGTKLGLAHWKRASSRGEAGTSGFLSVTDSNFRVPAELGQESQASSCLRKGTPLASRVVHGVSGPLSNCVWNLQVFQTMHGGVSDPSFFVYIHRVAFEEVSGHRVLIKSGPGNRGLSACVTTHEATSQIFSLDRPHPEVRWEGWEPLPDKAQESTLQSQSGGEQWVSGIHSRRGQRERDSNISS